MATRIELTIDAESDTQDHGAQMTLAEMSPSGVLMAAAGRMTFRNNLARQTLGPFAELDEPEAWVGALRVAHRDGVVAALRRASEEGQRGSALAALDRPGGATTWLRVEAAPATDEDGHTVGYVATLLDVTTETETREQLQEAQAQLWQLANHDQLTGLPNRMQFTDRLERALGHLRREHRSVAILYCDLDLFKPVNDERGHHSGDLVLIEVAKRLPRRVRRTDTVCRFGGDEFVVICEGFADTDGIRDLGERLIAAVHPAHRARRWGRGRGRAQRGDGGGRPALHRGRAAGLGRPRPVPGQARRSRPPRRGGLTRGGPVPRGGPIPGRVTARAPDQAAGRDRRGAAAR